MKRALSVLMCTLAALFALGLCACGQQEASSAAAGDSASATESAAAESDSTAGESAAESESVAEEASEGEEAGESSGGTASESEAAAEEAAESAAGEAAEGASGASAAETASEAAGGAEHYDFVDECTDEHGNITLYALTELKGWQLETLLDQQGYVWDGDECVWVREADGASFAAVKETGAYTQDTYAAMNEKGGAIVAMGLNNVAGYATPQEALSGNARCVIEDSYFTDDGEGIAVFYGPSMKEYLAIIGKNTENTTLIMVFSQEAPET